MHIALRLAMNRPLAIRNLMNATEVAMLLYLNIYESNLGAVSKIISTGVMSAKSLIYGCYQAIFCECF